MSKVQVVVGGQFGSEGKGAVCAWLARVEPEMTAVRVGGPNAGHTVVENGETFRLRHVPVAAVTNPEASLLIAAGSEVDLGVLESEVQLLENAGYSVRDRLCVDGSATVIQAKDMTMEQGLVGRIGSTGKGVGSARSSRVMRVADTYRGEFMVQESWKLLAANLVHGGMVQIEAAQGYGLGLHTGFYPFCTSGDCRAIDALAATGISPWQGGVEMDVWVVVRPNPIRVAGNSGPLKGETTWERLGLGSEFTTVTKKVRRVGAWDGALVRDAVWANGGEVQIAMTMVDHVWPELAGKTRVEDVSAEVLVWIRDKELEMQAPIGLIGTGPSSMIDLRWES